MSLGSQHPSNYQTHLRQLCSELRHIILEDVLVTEGRRQLCLTPMEQGLQLPHSALGHRELAFTLLGTAGKEGE